MKLYCATTNPGKLREFRLIVEHFGGERITVDTLHNIRDIEAPEETGSTFEENAALKAVYYSQFAAGPLFADDSGLAVDALHGAPGVYSARFAGEHAGDAANNQLLLERLRGVHNRTARFVCVIALAEAGEVKGLWRGEVEGRIINDDKHGEASGTEGFGYDPLFYFEPFGATFGQVPAEKKLLVSHRSKALEAMIKALRLNS